MVGHDIIVAGASAGGVEALMTLVRALPPDLPAAVFVVLHVPPEGRSALPAILEHAGRLPARHPRDGEPIRRGQIYVAPPDHHLLVQKGRVRIVRGPRENRHRPAIDVLFRTAALAYGSRVVGVVLSGALDDGTAGLIEIRRCGGISVVQDPKDALFQGMPESAIENDEPGYVLPIAEIGPLLVRLAREPVPAARKGPVPSEMEMAADMAMMNMEALDDPNKPGTPSVFACPDCGGVLWETTNGEIIQYRCRVGHAFAEESLIAEQSARLEAALWAALRGLEEKAALACRIAQRARDRGHQVLARRYEEQARDAQQHAGTIRDVILTSEMAPPDTEEQQRDTGDG